jgi:hypothetical protein
VAAVVLATLLCVKSCQNVSLKRSLASTEAKYRNCINAPIQWRVDTIHDTISIDRIVYLPRPIEEKPTVVPANVNCDSLKLDYYTERYYADVLKTRDFDLYWRIMVSENSVRRVTFPSYTLHRVDSVGVKVVDTCFDKPPVKVYKARNHIGMYVGTSINNFHSFPSFQTGLIWNVKDKWGVMPGVMYNPVDGKFYGQFGVAVYFN